jgi:hypothetical protein
VGLGPPASCRKLPRDVASGDAPVTMTLPSNNRNESYGKSLSGNPLCASFDRRFGWWRADLGRASELPRSCRCANHEHRQDANLYGGRTGRSRSTRKGMDEIQHRPPVQLRAHHDGLLANLHRVTHVSRNGKCRREVARAAVLTRRRRNFWCCVGATLTMRRNTLPIHS